MALALGHPVGQPGILGFRHALTASKVGYGLWLCLKKRHPEQREGSAFAAAKSRSFTEFTLERGEGFRMTLFKAWPEAISRFARGQCMPGAQYPGAGLRGGLGPGPCASPGMPQNIY